MTILQMINGATISINEEIKYVTNLQKKNYQIECLISESRAIFIINNKITKLLTMITPTKTTTEVSYM